MILKLTILLFITVFSILFSSYRWKAAPLSDVEKGKLLYKKNCMSCHNAGRGKLTAIGLRDAWDEIPKPKEKWFIEYVQNPKLKHETKDELILKIEERIKKDGVQMMIAVPLTKEEIKSIIAYVKSQK